MALELTEKQYVIIRLIDSLGTVKGRTRMQKLMFLLQKEFGANTFFKFSPYSYGPYSRDLQETIAALIQLGLVEEKKITSSETIEYVYSISPIGKQFIDSKKLAEDSELRKALKGLHAIDRKYQTRSGLVGYVYSNYPQESGLPKS